MALEKQVISYALTEALNTKVDPKAVPPPQLLLMDNARRDKAGRISKRFGHEKLGINITASLASPSSDTIEDADALGTYNDELLVFAKQNLYSYSETGMISADKGGCVSATVTVDDVVRNSVEQTQIDVAVNNDVALVLYEGPAGVYANVIDNRNGALMLRDHLLGAGSRPRCVSFGSRLYGFYYDGAGNIKAFIFNPLDPRGFTGAVTVSSAISTGNPNYDVIVMDTYILCGHNVQGAVQTRLLKLDNALTVLATVNIAEQSTNTLALVRGANSRIFVLFHNATGVRCAIHDVFLVSVVAPFTVEAVANVATITGYAMPDGTGLRVFYHVTAASTYNHLVRQNTITNAGTPGTPAVFLRSVGIASKAWAYSPNTSDKGFIGLVHESTNQPTFFVARNDGMIVAKAQQFVAGGMLTRSGFPSGVWEREAGKFQFGIVSRRLIGSESGNFTTLKGTSLVTIDFSDLRNFSSAQLAGNSLIVGGIVQGYDAQSAVEQGFHLFPENAQLAQGVGGALTALGTYSYKICYEWVDNKGQVHRSAPSTPQQIILTGGNNRVTLTIPTLRLTQKKSATPRSEVMIVVYRTATLGNVYYQATSPTSPTYNDTTVDTITYNDDLADSTLTARPPLYTEGGAVENVAPPSASLIEVYRNRVILGGTEDDTVWHSKQVRPNRPVEFNDAFIIKVDPVHGRLRAIKTLDDKLIFFKENAIFYTYGDGPDDTGAGGIFTPPELITADAGCVDSKSLVSTPVGLMFKSRKGYYLLNRALENEYVGAEVEEFNDYEVTAATLIADANEVRFTTEGGPTLVYNYFFKQWMTWTTFVADDALSWKNQFVAIMRRTGSTALVVKQVEDFFLDVDQTYSLRIGLAWASFAQLQGFQRVWRAVFLGDYKSPHTLKLSVAYNFQPVISDEYYWSPVDALDITEFGDGAFYGTDPVFGGESANRGVYQVRCHIVQQKCQALRFILEDINPEDNYEGFSLTSCAFEVGIKKGAVKLQAAQTL